MRCKSCNDILSESEDSLTGSNTQERVQLCVNCLPLPDVGDTFGYASEMLDINDNITLLDN